MPATDQLSDGYFFSWIDFVFPIAVVGLVILVFNFKAKKENFMPIGDPKFKRGLDFHLFSLILFIEANYYGRNKENIC